MTVGFEGCSVTGRLEVGRAVECDGVLDDGCAVGVVGDNVDGSLVVGLAVGFEGDRVLGFLEVG